MDAIEYSCAPERLDFARIHAWLTASYWSPGIPRELVERGFAHSVAVCGAYVSGAQIAVGRVVSDTVRFAYLADVFVDEAWRRRGIARALVRELMATPTLVRTQT